MYTQINVALFYGTRVSDFGFQAGRLCVHTHFVSISPLFYPVVAFRIMPSFFHFLRFRNLGIVTRYRKLYRFRSDVRRFLQEYIRLDITRIILTVTFLVFTKAPANREVWIPCGDPHCDHCRWLHAHHAPYSIQPKISCGTAQICCVPSTWPSRLFSRLDHSRAKQITRWVPLPFLWIILILLVLREMLSWKSNYPECIRVVLIILIIKRRWNMFIFMGIHK